MKLIGMINNLYLLFGTNEKSTSKIFKNNFYFCYSTVSIGSSVISITLRELIFVDKILSFLWLDVGRFYIFKNNLFSVFPLWKRMIV